MATTVSTVLAYAETKSQSGTGNLNNSVGLGFFNEALLDFRSELIKRGIDGSQLQEAYLPSVTVSTPPTGSTFLYPADMYFLKAIEVNMINTTQQNYVQAAQVDIGNTPNQVSYDFLRTNQPSNQPLFDDRGDYYEIFPSFTASMNLVNPIKVIYYLTPTPYPDTSTNLTYPDTLDWYILALKTVSLYYESLNKFDEAEKWELKYIKRVDRLVETIGRGVQQESPTAGVPLSGWEF